VSPSFFTNSVDDVIFRTMEIEFTSQIFKEGHTYVSYSPQLDISSCGRTKEKAHRNLLEAVRLFLEEAERMGTLEEILQESGYVKRKKKFDPPKFVSMQSVTLPLLHAKT
jgi:hypothetical protein